MKLKFEEAIAVPESARHSVADSIDYDSIGTFLIEKELLYIYSYFLSHCFYFLPSAEFVCACLISQEVGLFLRLSFLENCIEACKVELGFFYGQALWIFILV